MAEKIYKAIRLEKEALDFIEKKIVGKDFTEKFHKLVYMLIKELPNTQKELKDLNTTIKKKTGELNKINETIQRFKQLVWDYESMISSMERVKSSVDKMVNFCENVSKS